MSAQGLEVIDETVQQTHEWINDLAARTGSEDKRQTLRLMRAVLRAIRDHIPHTEAAHLSAQLPVLVRGFYWEGWRPAATPVHPRGREAFVGAVRQFYDRPEEELAPEVRAVFALLEDRLTEGEIGDVRAMLPEDVRQLLAA